MYGVNPLNLKMHERRQRNIHMAHNEVVESVRLAIIAELDLLNYYEQVLNTTRDDQVKKVFGDIVKEKEQLIGMLLALLARLEPGFPGRMREGVKRLEESLGVKVEL